MNTFRQEMERIAEELCPGNEMYAKLMSNAADTQERVALEVLKAHDAAGDASTKEKT